MKLRLRLGRQQARPVETDAARTGSSNVTVRVPVPREADLKVVRAGSYCRGVDIGQRAVTITGRVVVAVDAGHCCRWAYSD